MAVEVQVFGVGGRTKDADGDCSIEVAVDVKVCAFDVDRADEVACFDDDRGCAGGAARWMSIFTSFDYQKYLLGISILDEIWHPVVVCSVAIQNVNKQTADLHDSSSSGCLPVENHRSV